MRNFRVGNAEEMPLEAESVDLVTTGQSIHWYNTTKFYEEVNRILKKNGVLAVYGYNLPEPEGSSAPQIIRKVTIIPILGAVIALSMAHFGQSWSLDGA